MNYSGDYQRHGFAPRVSNTAVSDPHLWADARAERARERREREQTDRDVQTLEQAAPTYDAIVTALRETDRETSDLLVRALLIAWQRRRAEVPDPRVPARLKHAIDAGAGAKRGIPIADVNVGVLEAKVPRGLVRDTLTQLDEDRRYLVCTEVESAMDASRWLSARYLGHQGFLNVLERIDRQLG
ncbi:unannotated protein [freshwater metagenome]|uniref:Unannotated protein n=1 Tax=freshwater metagenome TaxID=449393 RepID=A0A6J7IEX5_9ZZZZ